MTDRPYTVAGLAELRLMSLSEAAGAIGVFAVQFIVITHDYPPESKQSLRDAIVEALDEAFLAGVAAAQRAKEIM